MAKEQTNVQEKGFSEAGDRTRWEKLASVLASEASAGCAQVLGVGDTAVEEWHQEREETLRLQGKTRE